MRLGSILGKDQAALWSIARQNEAAMRAEEKKKREREIKRARRKDQMKRYRREE